MADRILSKVLKALETVYQFPGGQKGAPESMELDLPIQVVHDASSSARIGRAPGMSDGWWLLEDYHNHLGLGTLVTTPSLRTPGFASSNTYPAPYNKEDLQAWIYDSFVCMDDAGDFALAMSGLQFCNQAIGPVNINGANTPRIPLYYGTAPVSTLVLKGSNQKAEIPIPYITYPGGNANDSVLYNYSTADNVGTCGISIFTLFWLGPKGTPPPVKGG